MTEDSQQISVAELLKRNGQSVESRGGRRRRGVAGGISVAELTGEIPIVRPSGSRAAIEPTADESGAIESDATESDTPESGTSTPEAQPATTEAVDSAPPVDRPDAQSDEQVSKAPAAQSTPVPATVPPATVPPATEAPARVAAAERVPADRTAAFAVSFDDDDDEDDKSPEIKAGPDKAGQDKAGQDKADSAATSPTPASEGEASSSATAVKPISKSAPGQWVSRSPLAPTARSQPTQEPALLSGQTLAGDLMRQERAASLPPAPRPPILPQRIPANPDAHAGLSSPAAADDRTELIEKITDSGTEETSVVDLVKAQPAAQSNTTAQSNTATTSSSSAQSDASAESAVESADKAEPAEAGERNSIREWAVLAGQVVVALIVGGAMFKGFEKLWDVLPWVALVLALIVIVGLVAVVRVLRKTDDITSFVIAVVVGMIVTLGPLAFLLTSG